MPTGRRCAIVPAPPIEAIYGNPGFQGMMYTAGSNAVTSYYTAAAHVRRAGAPGAARQRRQEARRAGRGADHRAERGGARQVRPQAELWRDRRHCRGAGQGAGDQAGGAEEAERLPADRQGRDAGRAAGQGQRQRALRHRRAGPEHALRHRAARAGRRLGAGQDRRRQGQGDRRRGRDRPAALRRRRAGRHAVGGVRGAPGAHPVGDLDPDRHGLGLRQRQGPRAVRRRRQESRQRGATEWSRIGDPRGADAEGRLHHGGRVPLRLCLSRADGAAERHRVGVAGGRCGRDLGRHAKPDHRDRSAGQAPRHPEGQGEAARHADGRRLRPARQPRRRFHHRRGADVEGGRPAGEGDVDARGRRPQRPLPSDLRPRR